MDICEAYENWEDWDSSERFAALEALIRDSLTEWGFDGVAVVNEDLEEVYAEYDSNTIYLDFDAEDDDGNRIYDDPETAIYLAYHEVFHALLDQAGLGGGGLDEEAHAASFGSSAKNLGLEGCVCSELAESGGGGKALPFPWGCDLDYNEL